MKLRRLLVLVLVAKACPLQAQSRFVNFVFTSDAHYGITRTAFRGETNVDAVLVNEALVKAINSLPGITLPADSGVNANQKIAAIDFVVEGGDIANRMEGNIQSAATSWYQFKKDYLEGISLQTAAGKPTPLFAIPGNHDISNTIGFYKPMRLKTDPTAMVQLYNLMLKPATPLNNKDYSYPKNKIHYSRNIAGIHFLFLNLWPDSTERVWMQKDLAALPGKMPVVIFAHDQPEAEAKHFTNPSGEHFINSQAKFENLLQENYKDADSSIDDESSTEEEQLGWQQFLRHHPEVKAYFHGNSNFNQFYNYSVPGDKPLLVFRVDSPMKGAISKKDERKLSFQVATIDTLTQEMTVRECLWNSSPQDPDAPLVWGDAKTISLALAP